MSVSNGLSKAGSGLCPEPVEMPDEGLVLSGLNADGEVPSDLPEADRSASGGWTNLI